MQVTCFVSHCKDNHLKNLRNFLIDILFLPFEKKLGQNCKNHCFIRLCWSGEFFCWASTCWNHYVQAEPVKEEPWLCITFLKWSDNHCLHNQWVVNSTASTAAYIPAKQQPYLYWNTTCFSALFRSFSFEWV